MVNESNFMNKVFITGSAGFIGFHFALALLKEGFDIISLDNINDYYEQDLKYARLNELGIQKDRLEEKKVIESDKYNNFKFVKANLEDKETLFSIFNTYGFDYVVNLAAQVGVRYSLINPYAYVNSNLAGFMNILECCRNNNIKHLVYASSSSVYGLNEQIPFSTHHNVDHPISLYAATKKVNELMAHTYSHLYNLPTTGLRFFTVYGPWGRPDMAPFKFTKNIINEEPIDIYNYGNMERDFTYIEDIVQGIKRVMLKIPEGNLSWNPKSPDASSSKAPYKIYNIGNNSSVQLMDFIEIIERKTGKKAKKNFLPLQPGDVLKTYADIDDLIEDTGFKPSTGIETGMAKFIDWYVDYYKIKL